MVIGVKLKPNIKGLNRFERKILFYLFFCLETNRTPPPPKQKQIFFFFFKLKTQASGLISENKIIILHLEASGLNISNIGFRLVFTIEFKLQAFNSEIGSLKEKISDYKIEIYLSCFMLL